MPARLITILFCLTFFYSASQDPVRVHDFEQRITTAANEERKIDALLGLAEYYSVFKLESGSDSLLQKALSIAEVSSDKELVLKILFNNDVTDLNPWSSDKTFERSRNFVQKSLQYAQELKKNDYIVIAHIRLAGIYRKRALFTEAIQQVTEAFTVIGNSEADSLRSILYIELGDIYIAKSDAVLAYKNYNTAFDIAYRLKNFQLESSIYHRFFEFYWSFGDTEMAKKYLLESLQLNTKHNDIKGLYKDYIDLTRLTDEKDYVIRASELADQLNSDRDKLAAQRLLFYWYMVNGKNSKQTFDYLYSNPELVKYFTNSGIANFHWQIANIYRYGAKYDSALHFYRLSEAELISGDDYGFKSLLFTAMAETYLVNHDSVRAAGYYEKTFSMARQLNQVSALPGICSQLGLLHAKKSNYQLAYYYAGQADSANKLLQANAARDKVVLLAVDRENKKRESDIAEAERNKTRKYNLQIMAITIVIAGVFVFLLFIGMFAVSKTTIRLLGYFAFISLFEFIILMLDHPIVSFTHAEPLKIWILKIGLIICLVPLQHFLENRLIKYLQSRKLLRARQRFSLKKWWHRITKPAPSKNAGKKKDTATL